MKKEVKYFIIMVVAVATFYLLTTTISLICNAVDFLTIKISEYDNKYYKMLKWVIVIATIMSIAFIVCFVMSMVSKKNQKLFIILQAVCIAIIIACAIKLRISLPIYHSSYGYSYHKTFEIGLYSSAYPLIITTTIPQAILFTFRLFKDKLFGENSIEVLKNTEAE